RSGDGPDREAGHGVRRSAPAPVGALLPSLFAGSGNRQGAPGAPLQSGRRSVGCAMLRMTFPIANGPTMTYETILVETKGKVGLIRLNRPAALNALNAQVNADMTAAIDAFEADANISCVILTGNEKAFAAGADIKEMAGKSHMDAFMGDFAADWDRVARMRKPVIAAVAGFALGGG